MQTLSSAVGRAVNPNPASVIKDRVTKGVVDVYSTERNQMTTADFFVKYLMYHSISPVCIIKPSPFYCTVFGFDNAIAFFCVETEEISSLNPLLKKTPNLKKKS